MAANGRRYKSALSEKLWRPMAAATEGTLMIEQEITLSQILTAREERVAIQNALLGEYKAPVISFTMNIAGPVKVTALSHRAFLWGMEQLRLGFVQNRLPVKKEFSRQLPTGDEGYFAVDAPAERIKALCVEIEEGDRYLGRLFDMDVIGTDGRKLERDAERPCIVCGKPGRDCASRRLHSVAELQRATASDFRNGFLFLDRDRIAGLATRALLEEVAVTPKPGLVDRANNGSHKDMDFFSFQASAAALSAYFRQCFYESAWRTAAQAEKLQKYHRSIEIRTIFLNNERRYGIVLMRLAKERGGALEHSGVSAAADCTEGIFKERADPKDRNRPVHVLSDRGRKENSSSGAVPEYPEGPVPLPGGVGYCCLPL